MPKKKSQSRKQLKSRKNIGPKNRTARLIVGIILIILSLIFYNSKVFSIIGLALGIIFILEAIFSYCIVHGIRGTKDMR